MNLSRADEIKKNLEAVNSELVGKTKLVAVSKTYPSTDIRAAYEAGQRHFGENKVQELKEKAEELADLKNIRWHFIGRLQSNKINMLLKCPNLLSIHSIDSIKLLNKLLSKTPAKLEGKLGVFLQVNASGESQKGGFESFEELLEAARILSSHQDFSLKGLMTIGTLRTDDFEFAAEECFLLLARWKEKLEAELEIQGLELSMGMSQDYPIAVEKGSDWVRIGSKIFGERTAKS